MDGLCQEKVSSYDVDYSRYHDGLIMNYSSTDCRWKCSQYYI